ncbi:hypothetical protein THTE_3689 [Thermogutta terrifontis]|uniref:Uncharacterized protein n=1 Tax=Thermogutta terrifontis TaxID=1331910 RepID=A0A286RK09_9BACT|nr:hypothetical protein THTE_3689 [Thermogutta terrifontis]
MIQLKHGAQTYLDLTGVLKKSGEMTLPEVSRRLVDLKTSNIASETVRKPLVPAASFVSRCLNLQP